MHNPATTRQPRARTRPAPARPAPVPACPVERAIHIIGGKWKLLVLRSLLLNGPQRYNQLLVSVDGISPKELTRNLRELTRSGLVAAHTARDAPYTLTPLGRGLMPVFKRLLPWGRRLIEAAPASTALASAPPPAPASTR
jgi:DNA-binding HxlR family transcriptional regulator